jgi:hypothetical protein
MQKWQKMTPSSWGKISKLHDKKTAFICYLAYRHCLHSKAKFVFKLKARFLFNG